MVDLRKKIVFVLGMHRSGTSLTAELVHAMGFSVPGTMLEAVGEINAHGFWESQEVVGLNERMLGASGLRWFHVSQFDTVFSLPDCLSGFSAEISSFLQAQAATTDGLVIKDPRLCLLWPIWLSAVDPDLFDVRVVYVNRHPSSVASSIAARDGFSLISGEMLWLSYFFSVFGQPGLPEVLFLSYESLLRDNSIAQVIADFLGVPAVSKVVVDKVIDPSLQRNPARSIAASGFIGTLADKVYASCPACSVLPVNSFSQSDSFNLFSEYISSCAEMVSALNDANGALAESRSRMFSLGDMHSHALATIKEKDDEIDRAAGYIDQCHGRIASLEQAVNDFELLRKRLSDLEAVIESRDRAIENNTAYIAKCENRISELHSVGAECEALRERLAFMEAELRVRDSDIERNSEYIASCELRIKELHADMEQFDALRCRLAEVESSLQQREVDVVHNTDYIQQCDNRIRELHEAMAEFDNLRVRLAEVESVLAVRDKDVIENAEYIYRCESRIVELDSYVAEFDAIRSRLAQVELALAQRDADVLQNTQYIERCHARIAELDAALAEFEEVRLQLDQTRCELENKNGDHAALALLLDACRDRAGDLEQMLAAERSSLAEARQQISILHGEVAAGVAQRAVLEEQLLLTSNRLQNLLASRVVRLVERLTIKTVH